ncbi:MAG: hypothetical protein ACK50E_07755 [Bacteroidota bacterium]
MSQRDYGYDSIKQSSTGKSLRILIQEIFITSITNSLIYVGLLVWILAIVAVLLLPDTYGRNLNFLEE